MAKKLSPENVYLPEVLFEFRRVGNSVRVTAIDPITATEITMVAPTKGNQNEIKKIAARKLAYVMAKKKASEKNDETP